MSTKKSNIYHCSCFLPPSPSAAPQGCHSNNVLCRQQLAKILKSLLQEIWHHCDTHILNSFKKLFLPGNANQGNWASWGCSWRALLISGWRQHQSLCWLQGMKVWSYRLRGSYHLPLVVPGRGLVVPVALWGLANEICQMQVLCGWSWLHTFPARGKPPHGDRLRPSSSTVSRVKTHLAAAPPVQGWVPAVACPWHCLGTSALAALTLHHSQALAARPPRIFSGPL